MNTILIADDNDVMRSTLTTILYYIDPEISILQARNGREAVSLANTHHPDLILIDGNMPEMNGVDASRSLREDADTSDIPLVGMTTNTIDTAIFEGLKENCTTVLSKPFNVHDLQAILQRLTSTPIYVAA